MLDLKWLRDNAEIVKQGVAAKNCRADVDQLLALDRERRKQLQEVESLKSQRNQANQEITTHKKSGEKEKAEQAISAMKIISQKIKEIDNIVGGIDDKIASIMYDIPNMPHNDTPVAETPAGNIEIKKEGAPKEFGFNAKDHLELAETNGWLSMESGSKLTGAGFPVYEGWGARLERALINFMIDWHTAKNGYKEVWVPTLVNRTSMTGTGQLPKFEEDMYRLKDEDYFLIPTAEVPITNLLRDKVLLEKDLPVKLTGYTPCFRREAGSYGKDTRGLSRVHQFDKIEMVKFVKPEDGPNELELLLQDAEGILKALGLHYRVILLCSADLSFSAAKCYDLEAWAPGTKKWFEVSSCSLFGDFQSRRMNIRYKGSSGKPELVHTLNGSGVALARTLLCLLETHQTESGSVELPEVLKPYMDR